MWCVYQKHCEQCARSNVTVAPALNYLPLSLFAQVHKTLVFHEPNSSDVSPEFTLKPELVYKDGTNVMGENIA